MNVVDGAVAAVAGVIVVNSLSVRVVNERRCVLAWASQSVRAGLLRLISQKTQTKRNDGYTHHNVLSTSIIWSKRSKRALAHTRKLHTPKIETERTIQMNQCAVSAGNWQRPLLCFYTPSHFVVHTRCVSVRCNACTHTQIINNYFFFRFVVITRCEIMHVSRDDSARVPFIYSAKKQSIICYYFMYGD